MSYEIVHTDDDGVPWSTSDDPAVLMECERGPIEMDDGCWVRPRMVRLRAGYVLEDVAHGPGSGIPLVCRPDHYERSMQVAQLWAVRRLAAAAERSCALGLAPPVSAISAVAPPIAVPQAAASRPPESRPLKSNEVAGLLDIGREKLDEAATRVRPDAFGAAVNKGTERRKEWIWHSDVEARAWWKHYGDVVAPRPTAAVVAPRASSPRASGKRPRQPAIPGKGPIKLSEIRGGKK